MRYIGFFAISMCLIACQPSEQPVGLAQNAEELPRQAIQFLGEILTDSSQSGFIQDHYYVLSDDMDFLPPTKMDAQTSEVDKIAEVLHEKDHGFIRSQLNGQRNLSLGKLRDKGFTMVPLRSMENQQITSDSLWTFVNQHYAYGFYSVSMPVFSSNFRKAYIRVGQLCGPSCGGGETRIYEYKHHTWELTRVVEVWVM